MTDFHMHTTFCDGSDTPEAMVRAAEEAGFTAIGFSGHSFTEFDDGWCMSREGTLEYISHILHLRLVYAGKLDIFLGVERDFYSTEPTDSFDYVIGSVHYVKKDGVYIPVDESPEAQREAVAKHYGGDFYSFCEDYYKTVAELPDTCSPDIIGHFDLISKFNEGGALFDEHDPRYVAAAAEALTAVVDKCPLFEINTGAVSRGYRTEPYPTLFLLKLLRDCGGEIIINSDAHSADAIGFMRDDAVELAKAAGFDRAMVYTQRGFSDIEL